MAWTPLQLLVGAVVLLIVGLLLWLAVGSRLSGGKTAALPPASPVPLQPGTRFQDQVVLVTGGTSGMGLAAALAFAEEGAKVIVCGRTPSKWAAAGVPSSMAIEYRQADVRIEADVKALIDYIVSKYGQLDVAVNAAGVAPSGPMGSTVLKSGTMEKTGAIWYGVGAPQPTSSCAQTDPPSCDNSSCPVGQQTGATSFCENPVFTDGLGIFYCLKWECNQMAKQPTRGSIVNIASINATIGSPGGILYGGAKGLCLLLTRGAAGEQAPNGIRINAVSPGSVYTPLMWNQFPPGQQSYSAVNKILSPSVPLGRIAMPQDIVGPILFLADSSQSGYVTGANLDCDGGMLAAPLFAMGS